MATTIIKSFNSDNQAIVDETGHLLTTGTATISGPLSITGPVDSQVAGLKNFQTSQYSVGTSILQLTPTPLANRSSISLRVTSVGGAAVFIGSENTTTILTGYPLYDGDTLQMDLTDNNSIYAISDQPGQTIYILEIA